MITGYNRIHGIRCICQHIISSFWELSTIAMIVQLKEHTDWGVHVSWAFVELVGFHHGLPVLYAVQPVAAYMWAGQAFHAHLFFWRKRQKKIICWQQIKRFHLHYMNLNNCQRTVKIGTFYQFYCFVCFLTAMIIPTTEKCLFCQWK